MLRRRSLPLVRTKTGPIFFRDSRCSLLSYSGPACSRPKGKLHRRHERKGSPKRSASTLWPRALFRIFTTRSACPLSRLARASSCALANCRRSIIPTCSSTWAMLPRSFAPIARHYSAMIRAWTRARRAPPNAPWLTRRSAEQRKRDSSWLPRAL